MNVKEVTPSLYKLERVFSYDEFRLVVDEFNYRYNHLSSKINTNSKDFLRPFIALAKPINGNGYARDGYDMVGDNMQLIRFGSMLKLHAEKILKRRLSLSRINTNIKYAGMESSFHKDGVEKCWTLLVFMVKSWDIHWGGDFQFFDGTEYYNIPVIPNFGCLFDSSYEHRGGCPNHLAQETRKTIAFTYLEVQ